MSVKQSPLESERGSTFSNQSFYSNNSVPSFTTASTVTDDDRSPTDRLKGAMKAAALAGRAAKTVTEASGHEWKDPNAFYRKQREQRRAAREKRRLEELEDRERAQRDNLAKTEQKKAAQRHKLLNEKRRREQIAKGAREKRPATKGILATERIPTEPSNPDAWQTEEGTKGLIAKWDAFEQTCEDIRASEQRLHEIYNKMFQGEQDELVERLESQLEQEKKWRGGDYHGIQKDLTNAKKELAQIDSDHRKELKQTVANAKTQQDLMEKTISDLENRVVSKEADLLACQEERTSCVSQLDRELTAQREAHTRLQDELDSVKAEAAAEQERLRLQIKDAEDQLQAEIDKLKKGQTEMELAVAMARSDAQDAEEAAAAKVEEEMNSLRRQADAVGIIQRDLNEARQQAAKAMEGAQDAQAKADEAYGMRSRLEEQIQLGEERASKLEKQLSTLTAFKAGSDRELKQAQAKCAQLRKKITLLKEQVETTENSLRIAQAGKSAELAEEAERNRRQIQQQKEELEQNRAETQAGAEKQQNELQDLQQTLRQERDAFEEERRGVAESIAMQLEQQRNAFDIQLGEEKRVWDEQQASARIKTQEKQVEERKELHDQIAEVSTQYDEATAKIATLHAEARAQQGELDSTRATLEDTHQSADRLGRDLAKVRDLRGSAETEKARLEDQLAERGVEIDEHKNTINILNATISSGKSRVSVLEREVGNLKSRLLNADQDANKKETVIQDAQGMSQSLRQRLITVEREKDELQEEHVTLVETLDATEEKATSLQRKMDAAATRSKLLQTELDRIKTVEEDTEAWKSKASRLADQLATVGFNEDRIQSLEEENSSLKVKATDLRKQVAQVKLEKEVAEKKAERLEAEGDGQSPEGPSEVLIKENFTLKQQLCSIQDKVDGYKKEVAGLKKSLNSSNFTKTRAEYLDAKETASRAEAELARVKDELVQAKKTIRSGQVSRKSSDNSSFIAPSSLPAAILSSRSTPRGDQKYVFVRSEANKTNDAGDEPAARKDEHGTQEKQAEEYSDNSDDEDENSLDARLFGAAPDGGDSDMEGSSDSEEAAASPKSMADMAGKT